MNCHRCHGLMVQDRAYDLQNSPLYCEVWRCISCGNMFDDQMLSNKHNGLPRQQVREHTFPIEHPTAA